MGHAVRNEYLGDVVDDGAEEGEAGGDDLHAVLHDELDGVLLQLREEDLRRVADERHRQLQRERDVADDGVVPRDLTEDLQVRLQRLHVLDEQLRPRLGEEVERREAGHHARVGAERRLLAALRVRLLTLLLDAQHALDERVHDLLAREHELRRRVRVLLRRVLLVLARPEQLRREYRINACVIY